MDNKVNIRYRKWRTSDGISWIPRICLFFSCSINWNISGSTCCKFALRTLGTCDWEPDSVAPCATEKVLLYVVYSRKVALSFPTLFMAATAHVREKHKRPSELANEWQKRFQIFHSHSKRNELVPLLYSNCIACVILYNPCTTLRSNSLSNTTKYMLKPIWSIFLFNP